MNCLYTYCTVKEKVDGSLWRQISSEWWRLEAIFSIFPYSHMINCATVSLIFAQTVKSQCSPLYPPPLHFDGHDACAHTCTQSLKPAENWDQKQKSFCFLSDYFHGEKFLCNITKIWFDFPDTTLGLMTHLWPMHEQFLLFSMKCMCGW